jgi:hypothetical protein
MSNLTKKFLSGHQALFKWVIACLIAIKDKYFFSTPIPRQIRISFWNEVGYKRALFAPTSNRTIEMVLGKLTTWKNPGFSPLNQKKYR